MNNGAAKIVSIVKAVKANGVWFAENLRKEGFLAICRVGGSSPQLVYLSISSAYGSIVTLDTEGRPCSKGNCEVYIGNNHDASTFINAVKEYKNDNISLSTPVYFNVDSSVKLTYCNTVEVNKIVDDILLGVIPAEAYLPKSYKDNRTCVIVRVGVNYFIYIVVDGQVTLTEHLFKIEDCVALESEMIPV